MSNPIIAIMSHQRPEVLKCNTLDYLQSVGTEFKIFVFCSGKNDTNKYQIFFNNHFMNTQLYFISGPDNYLEKCNYIYSYFPTDQEVFFMEDDIKELSILNVNNKLSKLTLFDVWVEDGFNECKKKKSKIFGIYPVYNEYFMKHRITYDFKFLIANAFGYISTLNNKNLLLHSEAKTDYERSVLYYINYGKIIRYNNIGAKTNNYTTIGGLNDHLRKDREEEGVLYLTTMYPEYFAYKKNTNSKFEEIKTKKIKMGEIKKSLLYL